LSVAILTVVFDACVLYPQTLRDLLLNLARTDLFRARWTDLINEEWSRKLLEKNPGNADRVARTLALVNQSVEDCLISGYEEVIPTLQLPDPDDRHVLAAAIVAQASVIVTLNLDDFPPEQFGSFGIEAQHPDTFVAYLIGLDQQAVCAGIRRMRERYKNPPMTAAEYVDSLDKKRLSQSTGLLRGLLEQI
jgi:predicted nucleic acid-binding protein